MSCLFLAIAVMEILNFSGVINSHEIILSYGWIPVFFWVFVDNNFMIISSSYPNIRIDLVNLYLRCFFLLYLLNSALSFSIATCPSHIIILLNQLSPLSAFADCLLPILPPYLITTHPVLLSSNSSDFYLFFYLFNWPLWKAYYFENKSIFIFLCPYCLAKRLV